MIETCNMGDWKEAIGCYWFLPALFYCMVAGSLTQAVRHFFGKGRIIIEFGIELASWTIWVLCYYAHALDSIPFFLHFVKMYPFFVLGTFFFMNSKLKELITKNQLCLTLSVVGYIASFLLPEMPINIHGLFAIVILMQMFVKYDTAMPRILSTFGSYSMEIYVFHWFMLPQLCDLQLFGIQRPIDSILNNGNFVLLMVVTGFFAVFVAILCISIAKIFHSSTILQIIVSGVRKSTKTD